MEINHWYQEKIAHHFFKISSRGFFRDTVPQLPLHCGQNSYSTLCICTKRVFNRNQPLIPRENRPSRFWNQSMRGFQRYSTPITITSVASSTPSPGSELRTALQRALSVMVIGVLYLWNPLMDWFQKRDGRFFLGINGWFLCFVQIHMVEYEFWPQCNGNWGTLSLKNPRELILKKWWAIFSWYQWLISIENSLGPNRVGWIYDLTTVHRNLKTHLESINPTLKSRFPCVRVFVRPVKKSSPWSRGDSPMVLMRKVGGTE